MMLSCEVFRKLDSGLSWDMSGFRAHTSHRMTPRMVYSTLEMLFESPGLYSTV